MFFDYLNSKHERINFTFETESNSSLSFLDVDIRNETDAFSTSTYRKPTFTGLINFYINFCKELDRLREYFCSNGYSLSTIESVICEKLNLYFEPKIVVSDVPKEKIFVKLPFMSEKANKLLSSDISKLFSKFYPQIDFRLIFTNNFSIGNFFSFKDKISPHIKSNIVYNYSCSLCSATYLGESIRHFHTRVSEHKGISPRTGVPYTKPPKINVYQHYLPGVQ